MEKKNDRCCTCEADFRKEVDKLVKEGTHSSADHARKQAEINEAFGKQENTHHTDNHDKHNR